MSDDNVEWLRAVAAGEDGEQVNSATKFRACADELAKLRKENERLKARLDAPTRHHLGCLVMVTGGLEGPCDCGGMAACELCGCSVPKGAAYCSECWLPP